MELGPATLGGLAARADWILSSILVIRPETAACTDWFTMDCNAATGDGVVDPEDGTIGTGVVVEEEVCTVAPVPDEPPEAGVVAISLAKDL